MANVVGVLKRDPCDKCQLPVFLAERLTVGKKVYHRTCLKCARCGAQLTPGSFYETEVDGVYCCETCPDEEQDVEHDNALLRAKTNEQRPDAMQTTIETSPVRSSIAARLAFFEAGNKMEPPAGNALLHKSLSDEEKTKELGSLQAKTTKIEETPIKVNHALRKFLYDEADGDGDGDAEAEAQTTKQEHFESTTAVSFTIESPKLLRKSVKPDEVDDLAQPKTGLFSSMRFTTTTQMQLSTPPAEAAESVESQEHIATSSKEKLTLKASEALEPQQLQAAHARITIDETSNLKPFKPYKDMLVEPEEIVLKITEENLSSSNESLELSESKVCLTKENTEEKAREEKILPLARATEDIMLLVSATDNKQSLHIEEEDDEEEQQQEERMLHATTDNKYDLPIEKQQQEEKMKQKDEREAVEIEILTVPELAQNSELEKDAATSQRLNVVRERLQLFEKNENNNNKDDDEDIKQFNAKQKDLEKHDHEKNNEELQEMPPKIKADMSEEKEAVEGEAKLEVDVDVEILKQEKLQVEEELLDKQKIEEELKQDEQQQVPKNVNDVPLKMETDENIFINEREKPILEETTKMEQNLVLVKKEKLVNDDIAYPDDLNPFNSDDDDDEDDKENINILRSPADTTKTSITSASASLNNSKSAALNPFDSSDDEIELEKSNNSSSSYATGTMNRTSKIPPPRPPPPRLSRNPFDDNAECNETDLNNSSLRRSSLNSSFSGKTPVPTPRSNLSQSRNPTPEPTPRLSKRTPQSLNDDYYGSVNSLGLTTPHSLQRDAEVRGSNNSLASTSTGGTVRTRRARKAPAPPPPALKELFPSTETINSSSKTSTPSSSRIGSPKTARKKRPAPAPPKPARLDPDVLNQLEIKNNNNNINNNNDNNNIADSKNLISYPLQNELESKLSDEEKVLLEGKEHRQLLFPKNTGGQRLITLHASLLADAEQEQYDESGKCDEQKKEKRLMLLENCDENAFHMRKLIPPPMNSPAHETELASCSDRQLEKLKDNKEAQNRNRQSQLSSASSGGAEDSELFLLFNKSSHGKWKRRKGPAPALPIPARKVLQMLPLQEIRHELDIIEVQQQGLEKQGVVLEKMIRDRCEGQQNVAEHRTAGGDDNAAAVASSENVQNSKEVEDLILQLFELVNEKNELFRRQAELMYLRRQHRLEQEQADLEYEIRVLMAQPERNKTDTDKSREEALIARLVEVVQLRNEVVECLEMDRRREAEEDLSIKQRLELHNAKRDGNSAEAKKSNSKLSKKEKKKQKEAKKLAKSKKTDAEKDADESELNVDKPKATKKKRKFLF